MKKYSVLMSLYQKESAENLRQAIESMRTQTVPPDEILIVRDGPLTEELQAVLDEYTAKYPSQFTVVGYAENQGLGYALNYGLECVRNELVARMDTDDISCPQRCEEQLLYMEQHPETDIVGGDIEEFVGDETEIVGKRIVPTSQKEINEYLKRRCPFNHMSVMYRRAAVQAAGGYQDWFWNEDYFLWIRMYLNGAHMANTGTVLVHVRVGEEMYQRRGGKKYFASEIGLQKYMLQHRIISRPTYVMNCLKRFIVQRLLPNKIRGWVFRTFARS